MAIKKCVEKLATFQEKHPVLILLLVLAATVFLGYHAFNLQTDSSFDSMYRDDSDYVTLKNFVSSEFGSTDTLFVLVAIDDSVNDVTGVKDIRDPQVLAAMQALQESLLEETTVASVFSIVNMITMHYQALPESLEESKRMMNSVGDISLLVSNDLTAMNMIVQVDIQNKPGSLARVESVIAQKIQDAEIPVGVKFVLTGQPTMLNRIMNLLIFDNLFTIGIALFFVSFILWIAFRSFSVAVITLTPVVISLLWLAGILSLLNIRVTMMIAAVGAMMVGMGVDYAVHITHSYNHYLKRGQRDATARTVKSVGAALFASALTTIAGFLAMLTASGPSPIIQGTVLSIGIACAFVATLVALPALLVIHSKIVFGPLEHIVFKIRSGMEEHTDGYITKILGALATVQTKTPKLIIVLFFVITFLLAPGMGGVRFDTDNANWIPDNDPVIEAFSDIGNYFGGTEQLNILVMVDKNSPVPPDIQDLRDPRIIQLVDQLDQSLERLSYVDRMQSPTDGLRTLNNGVLPNDIEEIKKLIPLNQQVASAFNDDYSAIKLTITSDTFGRPDKQEPEKHYDEILDEISTLGFPEGIRVTGQGGIAQFKELQATMQADTGKTTGVGFILVIIVAALLYRSLTVGLLAFFPIIFSIIWTIGIMGYVDLPFTILTSGMLAIVMGIGIDFSIHLIHKIKEALEEGSNIKDSVVHALMSTGEAITISTITTVIGFMSLMLASLLVTQRLGMTLAIAIASCFVCCILLVPAVITIEHQIKQRRETK